jgi:hypothetical protein
MERRKAFATAGAVTMTALAAVVALGANVGIFGLTGADDGPGQFKLVGSTRQSSAPRVRTEVVDVPVPVALPGGPPTGSSSAGSSSAGSSSAGSSSAGSSSAATSVAPPAEVSGGDNEAAQRESERGDGHGDQHGDSDDD